MDWYINKPSFSALAEYCKQDVRTEKAISETIPSLLPIEQEMAVLDAKINDRGIKIDFELVCGIEDSLQEYEKELKAEFRALTHGEIDSPRQVLKTLDWLKNRGYSQSSLTKQSIADQDLDQLTDDAKRVLELRAALSRSSTAKFRTLKNWCCADGRVRGLFVFNGAERTGRWAGRGPQFHNLPSPHKKMKNLSEEDVLDSAYLLVKDRQKFLRDFGELFEYAPGYVRTCFCSDDCKSFLQADFSQIESRVLAWIADEEAVLSVFCAGEDIYKYNAGQIGLDPDKGRSVGKVMELACGYGGGLGAMRVFSPETPPKEARSLIDGWRDGHPETVRCWQSFESCAFAAVLNPGNVYAHKRVKFCKKDNVLKILLPSGRMLHYWWPSIRPKETPWGEVKDTLHYYGQGVDKKWELISTFGGKITENIVQATARDLLRDSLLRLDREGYRVVGHVHDEVLCEEDETESLEDFVRIFAVVPEWANGLPIAAEGWKGKRFKK